MDGTKIEFRYEVSVTRVVFIILQWYSFEFCRVKSPFRFFPREKRGKLIDAFGYIRLKYIVCQRIDSKSRGNLQPRINLHLEVLVGGMVVQTVVCGLTELRIRDCSPWYDTLGFSDNFLILIVFLPRYGSYIFLGQFRIKKSGLINLWKYEFIIIFSFVKEKEKSRDS